MHLQQSKEMRVAHQLVRRTSILLFDWVSVYSYVFTYGIWVKEGAVEFAKPHLERCRETMSFPSSLLESYAKAFEEKQPREAVRILYSACDYTGVVRILVRIHGRNNSHSKLDVATTSCRNPVYSLSGLSHFPCKG